MSETFKVLQTLDFTSVASDWCKLSRCTTWCDEAAAFDRWMAFILSQKNVLKLLAVSWVVS